MHVAPGENVKEVYNSPGTIQYEKNTPHHVTSFPNFIESCLVLHTPSRRQSVMGRPLLNVGSPKMGTSSLKKFFACRGYSVSHYSCGKSRGVRTHCGPCMKEIVQNKEQPLHACGKFYAYTEMNYIAGDPCVWPQIGFLDDFHSEFPNAIYVQIFCDIKSWISRVKRWPEPEGTTLHQALK